MLKLVVFDLDGVLIDARSIHFESLNMALATVDPKYAVTVEEHVAKYDGHPTKYKLNLLTKEKGLPDDMHQTIWARKQEATLQLFEQHLKPSLDLVRLLVHLKLQKFKVYIGSNSIRKTIEKAIECLGVDRFVDGYVSNEDVPNCKPAPDVYLECMRRAGASPKETLVFEDSPVGVQAAKATGAFVCQVYVPKDVTLNLFTKAVLSVQKHPEKQLVNDILIPNLNVLIPMAGLGSRFANAGYALPKPMIDVKGVPMIEAVVANLGYRAHYIFVVQKEHEQKYQVSAVLDRIAPRCSLVYVDGLTEGAACTVLAAADHIDNDDQLIIANSDQILEWDPQAFLYVAQSADACISTFEGSGPKWSYARVDEAGLVTEVAEKKEISNLATTGVYYWKRGRDFVRCARKMIEKNIRTNNEFYVCPVFNEAIEEGLAIKTQMCSKMWGVGTPEDLGAYLESLSA